MSLVKPTDANYSTFFFADDEENANIEVIVMADENEDKESLLKSILHHQQQAFGRKDVLVARTLNQLGEVASECKEWKQSEEYFREAFEILKTKASDKQQLSAISMKLVNALEKQGDLKKVVAEIQDIKHEFENSELKVELSGLLEKVKQKIGKNKSDETPENR